MEFIEFFCGMYSEDLIKENGRHFLLRNNPGIWEIASFDADPKFKLQLQESKKYVFNNADYFDEEENEEEIGEIALNFYRRIPEIMENVRKTKIGRQFLENLCHIKIAVIHDDTLFCHTDPTIGIISDLTKNGDIHQRVTEINKIFQENLRSALFNGTKVGDDFKKIKSIYLNVDNREYFTEEKTFVKYYNDLMNIVLADLYEKNMLKEPSSVLKKYLDIYKLYGENWNTYGYDLTRLTKINNIDRYVLQKSIDEWKIKNNLKGDYQDIVYNIINALKNKNADQIFDIKDLLIKEINESNPPSEIVNKVKNFGINTIIHGHSPRRDERFYNENNFIIVSPHALFQADGSNQKSGIFSIKTNGEINLFGKSFRETVPLRRK